MYEKLTAEEIDLASHLIDKYRESVELRYTYKGLNERFELSSQINEDVIQALRSYFLESIYPRSDERKKLDAAFNSLSSFLSKPAKTWKLLGNLTLAVFKFGKHFPQALKAGIASLESYVSAKRFEQDLLQASQKLNFTVPLSSEQFELCIAEIPKKDIEAFTDDIVALFRSMSNVALLKKTIQIMGDVINKMKKYPETYTYQDIEGINLGLNILKQGYSLFKDYPESLRKEIIVTIRENERWYVNGIFAQKQ